MKKIFYSLLAVAALASCAKTQDVFVEDNTEIKIKPTTALATKADVLAAIDGTEYPTDEEFDVYAYWANEPAGSSFTEDAALYLGEGGAVEFTNKGAYWGGTTTYYWPKNGSLRFATYSPSTVDMEHDLATDTYTVDGYTQPATTDATWDLLVAPTSLSYTSMTAAENVSVVFEHALSWITVKVVAKDVEAAKAFDIKKVTINDVVNVADLSAVMSGADKAFNWTLTDTKVPYVVYEGSQAVTETATVIENTPDGTVIIPQPTTTITVDYTQNALEGTPALEGQSITVDLVLDAENTPWEAGKHYVYTLVFGLDEILINPSVIDWEEVVVKGATGVATADALAAALAADQESISVILTADMDLTATEMHVAAGKNVVVDLGGQTVTVKALDPIKNLGTMTLKNGKVVSENSEATRRCVYNYGTMTIDNVEFVQAYDEKGAAINNAGIMTINNATVNAAYYSVWAENADSETIINGGTFTSTNNIEKENGFAYAIRVSEGKLTINGANVSGNHGAICALDGALATLNSGTYTLSTPCFTPGGNSSWVLYANNATVNYSEANCTLVKPDSKTNGYTTTENGGVITTF